MIDPPRNGLQLNVEDREVIPGGVYGKANEFHSVDQGTWPELNQPYCRKNIRSIATKAAQRTPKRGLARGRWEAGTHQEAGNELQPGDEACARAYGVAEPEMAAEGAVKHDRVHDRA